MNLRTDLYSSYRSSRATNISMIACAVQIFTSVIAAYSRPGQRYHPALLFLL